MGLFDKKICDICGEKIGLLGNRKLDDGNLCKDCAKKLSPWFEERRQAMKTWLPATSKYAPSRFVFYPRQKHRPSPWKQIPRPKKIYA